MSAVAKERLSMRDRAFWRRLTKAERAELMVYQMSRSYGARSAYLPDDCSECPVCSEPVFGSGWCRRCSHRHDALMQKAGGGPDVDSPPEAQPEGRP